MKKNVDKHRDQNRGPDSEQVRFVYGRGQICLNTVLQTRQYLKHYSCFIPNKNDQKSILHETLY